ncbi:MAG TPA: hypothetical protein VMZ91_14475 [Candidatus Paceibacterota bacterium]|nr:hypothetical protein [Candidatus Paceibacterota bacterium]
MNKKTLSVFDLDDTLLITPTFSDFAKKDQNNIVDTEVSPLIDKKDVDFNHRFKEFLNKIKSFFFIVFSKEIYFKTIGDFIVIFDAKTKAPLGVDYIAYIQELNPDSMASYGLKRGSVKDLIRAIGEQEGHLVITNMSGFHDNPDTVGSSVNDPIFKAYSSAPDKMILTGRGTNLRGVIEARLKELGLDQPNYGLMLFPGISGQSVKQFKTDTILQSIEDNGWDEIHFYEDKKEWLESAQNAVQEKYPNVTFYPHLIEPFRKL